jgi:ketosteroid isomerase-like protein
MDEDTMMSVKQIATRVVELCREGKNLEAIDAFYDENVESFEVQDPMKETRGFDAVRGKSVWWSDNHEVHSAKVEGPFVNGDAFCIRFTYDITVKASGKRHTMDEVGVYEVEDGKIISETFFY